MYSPKGEDPGPETQLRHPGPVQRSVAAVQLPALAARPVSIATFLLLLFFII